ncbi:MAG: HD domain-containing protein [Phycisphaerae bacterium]
MFGAIRSIPVVSAPALPPADFESLLRRTRFLLRAELTAAPSRQPDPLAVARAVDARDAIRPGHSRRVAALAGGLARAVELSARQVRAVELAGLLHDVGKLAFPASLLARGDALSPDDAEQFLLHPRIGHALLSPFDSLIDALPAVLSHHENYDGSGYPEGLSGEAIDLCARVLRVADVFDRFSGATSTQPDATTPALERMDREAGRALDPELARAFARMLETLPAGEPVEHALRSSATCAAKRRDNATDGRFRAVGWVGTQAGRA